MNTTLGRWVLGRWVLGRWVLGRWVLGRWVLGRWVLGRSKPNALPDTNRASISDAMRMMDETMVDVLPVLE
jgi:hypothetical protein